MSVLRGLMLIGSLGKVWSTTRFARNVYSSISIVAYFQLMEQYENGINQEITIDNNGQAPSPPIERKYNYYERVSTPVSRRRQRLKDLNNNINRIIYDK